MFFIIRYWLKAYRFKEVTDDLNKLLNYLCIYKHTSIPYQYPLKVLYDMVSN